MNAKIEQLLSDADVSIDEKKEQALEKYFGLLVEWNEKINLTAITEREDVYKKHFYDSLTPLHFHNFEDTKTLCDVGSGAGFPSLVLKIFFPHLRITIVEALEKRIKFLQIIVDELGLENVNLVHARAEDYAKTHRESFDIVTARAVARLPMLAELCVPMVRIDGMFIAMKGEQGLVEKKEATKALYTLGITSIREEVFTLDESDDQRVILFCTKGRKTPVKYPRNFGQIKSKPL